MYYTQNDSEPSSQGVKSSWYSAAVSRDCSLLLGQQILGDLVCIRASEYHNYMPTITSLALRVDPLAQGDSMWDPILVVCISVNPWMMVLAEALLIRKGGSQTEYILCRVSCCPFSDKGFIQCYPSSTMWPVALLMEWYNMEGSKLIIISLYSRVHMENLLIPITWPLKL